MPAESVGARIVRLVRRRLKLTIALCTILGAGGGALGWMTGHKTYASSGEIMVAPQSDDLHLDPSSDDGPTGQDYIDSQIEFIKSSRVIDRAIASDGFRSLGPIAASYDRDRFLSELDVLNQGQVLFVKVKDFNPKVAAAGAQAVLDAYDQLHVESEVQRYKEKLDFLDGELATSKNKQDDLENQIQRKFAAYPDYAKYGVDDLTTLFSEKLHAVSDIETKLREVQMQISSRDQLFSATTQPSTEPAVAGTKIYPPRRIDDAVLDEIGKTDAKMAALLVQKQGLETDLFRLQTHNAGSNNPAVTSDADEVAALDAKIQDYAIQYIHDQQTSASKGGGDLFGDRLHNDEEIYTQQLVAANADIEVLSKLKRDVMKLRDQIDEEKANREDLQKKWVALDRLSRRPDRVQVLQKADVPVTAIADSRPLSAAGAGFAGVMCAMGGIVLLGIVERRLREPQDAGSSAGSPRPILGMLPDLPEGSEDADLVASAGDCIHHIRTSLQLWYGWLERPIIVISAPKSGSGKTTLTLGLGVSYAFANSRTLLIDFDLVGGGLSRRAQIMKRDRLGRILRDQGKIELEHLREGLAVANKSGMKLGEALIKLHYLSEGDLTEALSRQGERSLGVLDALEGVSLSRCVTETEIPNLSILGIGDASAADAGRIAPADVQRLLDQCRKKYDIVLIDTGPLPGSLEGAAVAASADGVIFTVSRGELKSKLKQTIEYAGHIGCQVAGIVFNRATAEHLANSHFSSGGSPRSQARTNKASSNGIEQKFGLFGKSLIEPAPKSNGARLKKK
jgi:Mrp family chromosome partitioning ATPase/uncharacterized protein involved in exopolysaccharide biosynthesis